jgi:hypothetical protein
VSGKIGRRTGIINRIRALPLERHRVGVAEFAPPTSPMS